MIDRRGLAWYLVIAFALAWVLFVAPIPLGPPGSQPRQIATPAFWAAAMWAPGLAALVATRVTGRPMSSLGLQRLGPRQPYLWAWLLPTALTIATGVLTVLLGAGRFDPEFTMIRGALASAGAQGVDPTLVVVSQTAAAILIAPLLNVPFALGEELGWRGFLLPQLLPLDQLRAIAISSAIWGIWHAPVILQGHNYPTQPVLGVFLMVGFCLLAGTFLSWVYLCTGSPWAPALGHGAINAVAALPMAFTTGADPVVGGTLASLIGWIPLGLFAAWLLATHRLPVDAVAPSPPATTLAPDPVERGDEATLI